MFRRLGAFFLDILEVVSLAVGVFLVLYLLVMQPHKIKGSSMFPNFIDAEYLLTDKLTYRFKEPQRGDVIVFRSPADENEDYIKRIIGLPGDEVSLNENHIYINGKYLDEPYLDSSVITQGSKFLAEGDKITVPSDQYFVLGDNRTASSDSRAWGFVPKKDINGRAWFVYWPVKKAGTVEKISYSL